MPEIYLQDALNKAYVKAPLERSEVNLFKKEFINLLDDIREKPEESEEHFKNIIMPFLRKTWYEPDHYINTYNKVDLVIHNGEKSSSSIGVIIETKKPGKNLEMVSRNNLNVKSMQQLLLYYFRSTIDDKNYHLKHLIITNAIEWFIFDAKEFYQHFSKDKTLVDLYSDYSRGGLLQNNTSDFYNAIASPYIEKKKKDISYTYINIEDLEAIVRADDFEEDSKLVNLYKIFSPQHLLKKSFSNDNNTLNDNFYFELLYILGLSEENVEGKKLIVRCPDKTRQNASMLESAIFHLSDDIFNEDILFHVSFELIITWINRILFLKLLEAQLLKYQEGNKDFAFLNAETIDSYSELNTLFFKVLAVKSSKREESIKKKYNNVPYLNSSLFDKTDKEQRYPISNLQSKEMDLYSQTVLKDVSGNRRKGKINSLDYIFEFLNAYDFSTDSSEIIKEQRKTLINASVLGLIFEKINGYKEGSYYTPGFITSFICSETIRQTIINKFNETKEWGAKSFTDVYNKIDKLSIEEANEIINSITILDPAVGSGHFLVSALNEIIAIKSELGILADSNGKRIKDYKVSVFNDELDIYHADERKYKQFEYSPDNGEKQRLQETLFSEKRIIIENSLFGVDLNNNSVQICRLRLWIELLKSAFYTKESNYKELETLPNLDLNVKCGNSLISRFEIDTDISDALKTLDFTVQDYKDAVIKYKGSADKTTRQDLEEKIEKIKASFRINIKDLGRLIVRKRNVEGELVSLKSQKEFFNYQDATVKKEKRIVQLEKELSAILTKMDEEEKSKIYENAFEWRFEFPELLDNDGNFTGFDAVIGNPPYIRVQELNYNFIDFCKDNYSVAWKRIDISILFIELANKLLKKNGINTFITSNQFLSTEYGKMARLFLLEKCNVQKIINFGDLPVFNEALTYVSIFILSTGSTNTFLYSKVEHITDNVQYEYINIDGNLLNDSPWSLYDKKYLELLNKLKNNYPTLSTKAKCWAGLFSGKDDVFLFDKKDLDNIPFEKEILLPVLRAQDCLRYKYSEPSKYVIYPYKEDSNKTVLLTEKELKKLYPKALEYLISNKNKLLERKDSRKKVSEKKNWYGLIRFGRHSIYKKIKIISPGEVRNNKFSIDTSGSGFSCARVFAITLNDASLDIYFLLGILNSKLVEYYLHSTAPLKAGGYYQYSANFINSVPIPNSLDKKHKEIENITNLVIKLISSKDTNKTLSAQLELKIEKAVYKIYGLDQSEIDIIEGVH